MSSFVQDNSRHYTFSSTRAVAHDEATASYTFEAASLFSGSPPASAVYATVACESFSAINAFYSVNSKNNCITVDGFQQVYIEPGFYNCLNLAQVLQALLTPILGANFTCKYSTITGRITMANSGSFTIFGAPLTTATKLLGMAADHTYSGFSSYTFPNLADVQTVSRIIVASNLPTRNRDGSTGVAFLGSFAVSAGPFQFFSVEQNQFESMTDLQLSLSNLQIQLLDQDGLPAIGYGEWTICVELSVFHNPAAYITATPLSQFITESQQQLIDSPLNEEMDTIQ